MAGEWFYDEYAPGAGVNNLGLGDPVNPEQAKPQAVPATEERKRILDLFKN